MIDFFTFRQSTEEPILAIGGSMDVISLKIFEDGRMKRKMMKRGEP